MDLPLFCELEGNIIIWHPFLSLLIKNVIIHILRKKEKIWENEIFVAGLT